MFATAGVMATRPYLAMGSEAAGRLAAVANRRTAVDANRRTPQILGEGPPWANWKTPGIFRVAPARRRGCPHPPSFMAKQVQSIWGGRFDAAPAALMQKFSESASFDRRLAAFDILGSKAHSAMLERVGLITARERRAIHAGLDAIREEIAAGRFHWEER